MSKILKSVTLGDVKNGGIFRALGKEFVKLDADEHGCLVLAKDIWTRMPFRDGDDPECPNDLRRSEIMPYLGNCLAEFTKNGTPLSTFIPLRIDLQDTTGQNEYGIFEVRIGLLTLRGYGKYWRLIPKVDARGGWQRLRYAELLSGHLQWQQRLARRHRWLRRQRLVQVLLWCSPRFVLFLCTLGLCRGRKRGRVFAFRCSAG